MYASDFRALAREKLKGKWKITILIMLIAVLLGATSVQQQPLINSWYEPLERLNIAYIFLVMDGLSAEETLQIHTFIRRNFQPLVLQGLYALLLGAWMRFGVLRTGIAVMDGETPQLRRLFCRGYYGKALRLHLLRGLLVELCALALVLPVCLLYAWLDTYHFLPVNGLVTILSLPGYVMALRYAMADYLLISHPEMGVAQALRESGKRMRGRKWKLFCLNFSFVGWGFLCALPGVVLIYTSPAAHAALLGRALVMLAAVVPMAYREVATVAFFRHEPEIEKENRPLIEEKSE